MQIGILCLFRTKILYASSPTRCVQQQCNKKRRQVHRSLFSLATLRFRVGCIYGQSPCVNVRVAIFVSAFNSPFSFVIYVILCYSACVTLVPVSPLLKVLLYCVYRSGTGHKSGHTPHSPFELSNFLHRCVILSSLVRFRVRICFLMGFAVFNVSLLLCRPLFLSRRVACTSLGFKHLVCFNSAPIPVL